MTIHVSLPPDLEKFIAQQIASGDFPSTDDVVIEGLQILRDRLQVRQQKLAALRHEVDFALKQSKTGQTTVFDEKVVEEIKASGRERLKAQATPSA